MTIWGWIAVGVICANVSYLLLMISKGRKR